MALRKKPTGYDLVEWCNVWDEADHSGKLELCQACSVEYETGRHWRSDSGIPLPERKVEGLPPTATIVEEEDTVVEIPEELFQGAKVQLDFCTFDLETSNLTADFSVLLCAAIKPYGSRPIIFRADDYNPNWATNRMDDRLLTGAIAEELRKHAIIVTHYGSRFDIPYLRAKMVKYGFTPLPPMFGIDTYSIAKANFKVSSRRLENLARYFDLGKKHKVEGGLWMKAAMDGDVEALDEIVEHNKLDVELLEKLASLSFPYLRSIRKL